MGIVKHREKFRNGHLANCTFDQVCLGLTTRQKHDVQMCKSPSGQVCLSCGLGRGQKHIWHFAQVVICTDVHGLAMRRVAVSE